MTATSRRRTRWPTSPRRPASSGQRFFAGIETDSCKARLRANTDELIERGGFGSPTMFVRRLDVLRQRPDAADQGRP
jgi:hypothetical protein